MSEVTENHTKETFAFIRSVATVCRKLGKIARLEEPRNSVEQLAATLIETGRTARVNNHIGIQSIAEEYRNHFIADLGRKMRSLFDEKYNTQVLTEGFAPLDAEAMSTIPNFLGIASYKILQALARAELDPFKIADVPIRASEQFSSAMNDMEIALDQIGCSFKDVQYEQIMDILDEAIKGTIVEADNPSDRPASSMTLLVQGLRAKCHQLRAV